MMFHRCPRRYVELIAEPGLPDTWQNKGVVRTCSYCGSLHPEAFMKLATEGSELGPTDKNYKVYIKAPLLDVAMPKFYFQHLPYEDRRNFLDLLNTRKLNIDYPGHFYVLPFFIHKVGKV